MLRLAVPAEAAGVVHDTFLVAWSEVSRLHQPGRLRPWLFAVARNECHRRLRTGVRAAPAGAMDDTVQLAAVTEQAELRAMVAAALAGLDPMEREISELNLRHGLGGADLAAVLGVPARQAHALAARARAHLESSLRTPPTVGSAPPPSLAVLLGMLLVPALPNGMRDRIVALAADSSPDAAAVRVRVAERAAPFGADGFPVQLAKLAMPRWRGAPVLAAAAAAGALALLGGGMYYVNYASASGNALSSRYRPGIRIHPAVWIHPTQAFQGASLGAHAPCGSATRACPCALGCADALGNAHALGNPYALGNAHALGNPRTRLPLRRRPLLLRRRLLPYAYYFYASCGRKAS